MRQGKFSERPQAASEGRQNRDVAGHGAKTEALRERAILALLSEPTVGAAAKRVAVGERTLRRWMSTDGAFQTSLAAARREAFEDGMHRIQSLVGSAVETLKQLLEAKKHPAVRLGAARTVVELAIGRHDAEGLLKRLEDLEHSYEESSTSSQWPRSKW